MVPLCSFAERASPLVLDTSVAINLNATGCAAAIIQAIPNGVTVVDVAADELCRGVPKGRRDAELASQLIQHDLLKVVHLGEPGRRLFWNLVSGDAAETLDDGEAATIAFAAEAGAIALIDERKATRICGERFPSLALACTVDLLAHPAVQAALGQPGLADAVFRALQGARMHVEANHHLQWVMKLIGPPRVAQCRSLPKRGRRLNSA